MQSCTDELQRAELEREVQQLEDLDKELEDVIERLRDLTPHDFEDEEPEVVSSHPNASCNIPFDEKDTSNYHAHYGSDGNCDHRTDLTTPDTNCQTYHHDSMSNHEVKTIKHSHSSKSSNQSKDQSKQRDKGDSRNIDTPQNDGGNFTKKPSSHLKYTSSANTKIWLDNSMKDLEFSLASTDIATAKHVENLEMHGSRDKKGHTTIISPSNPSKDSNRLDRYTQIKQNEHTSWAGSLEPATEDMGTHEASTFEHFDTAKQRHGGLQSQVDQRQHQHQHKYEPLSSSQTKDRHEIKPDIGNNTINNSEVGKLQIV